MRFCRYLGSWQVPRVSFL
uniref:Uncharacterized protein n=1 Tax=Lepeophtheirus salmonis TaxID=72036 RepID=A0A0K2VA37_LEPSM